MEDLINGGVGFMNFADFFITPSNYKTFNTQILRQNAIIFCQTDYIDFLFENLRFSNRKYILITHFSDYHIDEAKFLRKPNCIKKWFALQTTYEHPDLIQIPAGFGVFWDKFQNPNELYQKWFFDNVKRLRSSEKNNEIVYCNYRSDYMRPWRHSVVDKIQSSGVNCYVPPDKNTISGRLIFPDYCEDMSKFKFIASPPGNGGLDAHRNWEAIYMGCIPIVIKNLIYKNYDLPILQVNKYTEVTNELLSNYLEFYKTHEFNYEHVKLSYWTNMMSEYLKNS